MENKQIDPCIHNPLLLIGSVREKLRAEGAKMFSHEPTIMFFVEGDMGCYFLRGSDVKLYYDADIADNRYNDTSKSIAEIEAKIVGIIVRYGRDTKKFCDLNEMKAWIETKN